MSLTFRNFFFTLFFLVGLFFSETSSSREPLIRKISFLEGLTSDVVYDLFVDKQGLLYLGTDKGLMTYNGVHFEQIQNAEGLGNSVSSIQQDKSGKIWCKNFANQLFYLENDKLIVDKNIEFLLEKMSTNLTDFYLGTDAIYILTQEAVYSYKGSKFKRILKRTESLNSMVFDSKNEKLYVSSNRFIYIFKNDVLIETQRTVSEQKILDVFKGELVYSTRALDKDCVVGKKKISLKNSIPGKTFLNQFSTTTKDLWLCTNKGIYEFDAKKIHSNRGF